MCVCECVCAHWGQPVLAPSALSCQLCPVSPAPAHARLVLVMLRGFQAAPSWQLLSRGHCGGTAGGSALTVLVQLQKHLWDHGNHSSAIKNKYIKLPETNRCLGKGKALTRRAMPGQVTTLGCSGQTQNSLAHAELGQTKTLEEQEGPWEDKP